MFRHLDAWNRGVDCRIVGPRLFLSIPLLFRVKGVDMGGAATKPDENAGIRRTLRVSRWGGGGQGECGKRSSSLSAVEQELAASQRHEVRGW